MLYVLFAIAAFMAIVTAFITNSLTQKNPDNKIGRIIVIVISVSLFITIAIYLLQQKPFY